MSMNKTWPISNFTSGERSDGMGVFLAQNYGVNEVLMNKIQPVRNILRKNVGVYHNDHADDGCQRHRMPEQETENRSFMADLIGRGGGNANRLGVHHLAHDATSAVGRTHQNRTEAQLLG